MAHGPVNVEHALLKTRSFRRRPGDIPYPVQHLGASCSLFDVWNNMFRTRCKNLTLHDFETPPAVVLDLGCGSGYWAIEAAKKWKESIIVGFDIKDIQPSLFALEQLNDIEYKEQHRGIAHRVKWVHGSLLESLPFRSDYFDFVRVVNIGLGVPEDEEISRVMKPGGVIEVIEEDPIFPCAQPPRRRMESAARSTPAVANHLPLSLIPTGSFFGNQSTATILTDSSLTLYEHSEYSSPTSTTAQNSRLPSPTTPVSTQPFSAPVSTNHYSPTTSTSARPFSPPSPMLNHAASHPYLPQARHRPSLSITETDKIPDLRDHSRLKAAWNAMLSSRFIAENTLTVLPFYLSSTFVDLQSLPPLKAVLPPNSKPDGSDPARSSSESFGDGTNNLNGTYSFYSRSSLSQRPSLSSKTSSCAKSEGAPVPISRTSSGQSLDPYTTDFAQMHLANTVHIVSGCKEAIWQEYKKLYDVVNVAKVVSPSAGTFSGYAAHSGPGNVKSSIRESFDDEWASWYDDMTDRIGMRALMSQLNWAEPPGQRPDWHVWRAKVQATDMRKEDPLYGPGAQMKDTPDLCRSMRGFIGRKPLQVKVR